MNKNTKSSSRRAASRRLRYGSVAVLLTAVFIAAVILVNFLFTQLDSKYNFSVDLTKTDIYGISDTTRELLSDLDREVTINFMLPRDQLIEESAQNSVVLCAENYEREFDSVKIVYHDIVKNPSEYKNLNYYTELGYKIKTTSMVVETADDYKFFDIASCFVTDEQNQKVVGFKGEARITSAILTVTSGTKPVITVTTNHGESENSELMQIFDYAGFEVKKVDLSTEEIDPETEIILINNPTKDFSGIHSSESAGLSEIEKLSEYLDSARDVMLFVNPGTPALPELEDLLEKWGISITHSSLIADTEQSVPGDIHALFADYAGEAYGSAICAAITDSENQLKTVVNYATPLNALFNESAAFKVDPVLVSSENAYTSDESGKKTEGPFNLMLLSSRYKYVDGDTVFSHFLVCGTTRFIDSAYTSGNAPYGNSAILYSTLQLMGNRNTAVDIPFRDVDNNSLTVDAEDVKSFAFVTAGILPLIVAILGIVVFIRRRHS